jgi:nitrogen fixation/metabolism regulation signal transduction histidine kinase
MKREEVRLSVGEPRQTVGIIVFGCHTQVLYLNPTAQQIMRNTSEDGGAKANEFKIEIAKLLAHLHESPETNMVSRILRSPNRHDPDQANTSTLRLQAIQIKEEREGSASFVLVVIEQHSDRPDTV